MNNLPLWLAVALLMTAGVVTLAASVWLIWGALTGERREVGEREIRLSVPQPPTAPSPEEVAAERRRRTMWNEPLKGGNGMAQGG